MLPQPAGTQPCMWVTVKLGMGFFSLINNTALSPLLYFPGIQALEILVGVVSAMSGIKYLITVLS